MGIVLGVVFAVIVGAALVWLVLHLGKSENDRKNEQVTHPTSAPTSPVSSVTLSGSSGSQPTTASTRSTASKGAP